MRPQRTCIGALAAALATMVFSSVALAQAKEVKIGVIYDYTGPFAAGGSVAAAMGTKIAIDMINERGGVEGYRITAIYADAQSKAEVAINEAIRLLDQEKVNLIMGIYSSAHCVPMAQRWTRPRSSCGPMCALASSVQRQEPAIRISPAGPLRSIRAASYSLLNESAKAKLNKDPKDLKIAIIYEDGPYGSGVAAANEEVCKKFGMQIVLKEGIHGAPHRTCPAW